MTEKELKVLFENNSNCYTEVLTDDGEFQEMAITFDVFLSLVKKLNLHVVSNNEVAVCDKQGCLNSPRHGSSWCINHEPRKISQTDC